MPMNISAKHHYLPEFYLKGFTHDSEKLFIYDKQKDIIKKDDYFPSSHFFIKHRNSVTVNGQLDDFPEKLYSEIDNIDKEIIKFIQTQESIFSLDSYQIFQLQMFLSNFLWRNPIKDNEYHETIVTKSPEENFYKLKSIFDNSSAPNYFIEQLKNSEKFIKSYRPAYGILKWMENKDKYDHENWRISYNPKHYVLTSDNPVITSLEKGEIFDMDFIFPLSKKFTLIRYSKALECRQLPPEFTLLVDVVIAQQAAFYITCSDREHLEQIVTLAKVIDPTYAKDSIFKILDSGTNS